MTAASAAHRRTRGGNAVGEGLRTILGAVLLALLIRSFGFEPFNIPSESMMPRLLVGDYLFVAKYPYGYSRHSFPLSLPPFEGRLLSRMPERGDVAVFKSPRDGRTDVIKRVIGLPGDRIAMRRGQILLNGAPVARERIDDFVLPVTPNSDCPGNMIRPPRRTLENGVAVCRYPQFRETLPGGRSYATVDQTTRGPVDTFAAMTVPLGHYFFMGDNRDDSADSRFAVSDGGVGLVPEANLVGRASATFYSTDGSAEILKPWTWVSAMRPGRVGAAVE